MRLLMWSENGQVHADKSKINTDAQRLHFYDSFTSIAYDKNTNTWYENGVPFVPTYPFTLSIDDGKKVIANEVKGAVSWEVQ